MIFYQSKGPQKVLPETAPGRLIDLSEQQFMWEVELHKSTSPGSYVIFYNVMYSHISLMEDANFLIKDGRTSPSYTESVHN